jgi:hypothetical protein
LTVLLREIPLYHVTSEQFTNGLVQSEYQVCEARDIEAYLYGTFTVVRKTGWWDPGMSKKTYCLAVVLTIFTTVAALAGGRGCRFDADGLRLMKDQPVFGELLQSKLSIVDNGQMGPDDSPWDDVIGRISSFMEFQATATATGDAKQKFLARVHGSSSCACILPGSRKRFF